VRDHIAQHQEYLELVPVESRADFGLGEQATKAE
jgi:hypothetical protein